MRKIFTIILLLLFTISFSQNVIEDKTFGNNGFYTFTPQASTLTIPNSIIQADGKIIVAGQRINSLNTVESFVARLNNDGTIDTSFANNGFFTNYQSIDTLFTKLFLYGNNIFVFFSETNTLLKLKDDGTLDATFGNKGIYIFTPYTFFHSSEAYFVGNSFYVGDKTHTKNQSAKLIKFDILTQAIVANYELPTVANVQKVHKGPNGKLLIESDEDQFYQTKLTLVDTDGNIDYSFGTNGTLIVSQFTTQSYYQYDQFVTIDDSNNIIYGLTTENTSSVIVKKYSSSGTLDSSFGVNGLYQQNNSGITGLTTLANQIYFCGFDASVNNFDLLVTKLNSNGSLDKTFGTGGIFIYNTNSTGEYVRNVNIISPTSFITIGTIIGTPNRNMFVGKFKIDPNLSTNEFETENKFFIQNPLGSKLNFFTSEKILKIEIYSLESKLIKVLFENNTDISNLSKSVYFAKVYFENGKVMEKKLIKN